MKVRELREILENCNPEAEITVKKEEYWGPNEDGDEGTFINYFTIGDIGYVTHHTATKVIQDTKNLDIWIEEF